MQQFIYTLIVFCGVTGLISCDIADNEAEPGISFTKIYDDRSFGAEYDPLDVVQTEDGGYLVLAATNAWNVYLLKTDADGLFTWEIKVDEAYVNPLAKLIQLEDQYFVFCMNEVTLATSVMQINLTDQNATLVAELDEIPYPLAVAATPDQSLLILGYERKSRSSTLHKLNPDFSVIWSNEYAVEEDMEETIIRHMSRTGRQLPFFTGSSGDGRSYHFNGFANYTLGLNFVNPQNGELLGTLNGFRDEGFVSTAYHLQGNQYALAHSSFGVNALLPQSEINPRAIASSSDLVANDFPEIATDARVITKEIMHKGRPVIIFGTNTKRRQIILYAYDKESGELLGTQYLGQTNPFQLGNYVSTRDGGLAVVAETFLAGRFSRPCLFKLSPEEVNDFIR